MKEGYLNTPYDFFGAGVTIGVYESTIDGEIVVLIDTSGRFPGRFPQNPDGSPRLRVDLNDGQIYDGTTGG